MSGNEELKKRLKRWSTERLKNRMKDAYQERRTMNPDNPDIRRIEEVIELFHAELASREEQEKK